MITTWIVPTTWHDSNDEEVKGELGFDIDDNDDPNLDLLVTVHRVTEGDPASDEVISYIDSREFSNLCRSFLATYVEQKVTR